MSSYASPILYLNMGGEMLYVLRQRLKAQKISVDKTIQVLDEVTTALLNPKILSTLFKESVFTNVPSLRSTLECIVLSSIMKLDKSSMDKLFDLMIMMVKYQLTAATGPREVILLTLNHTDAMRDMVSDASAQQCVGLVHQMIIDHYGSLTCDEVWKARNDCLRVLAPYCVRVSILLRLGLQNEDGSFNLTSQKYDERYEESDNLSGTKLKDVNSGHHGGSFNLFGDRGTILGKNIYSPTYGTSGKPNSKQNSESLFKDCGSKAELGMLAAQLGIEEATYERPFTLNILSNEDNDNTTTEKKSFDSANNDQNDSTTTKQVKTNFNKDYKSKLDNVYADFFEDEQERIKRNMDLLELLDEIE